MKTPAISALQINPGQRIMVDHVVGLVGEDFEGEAEFVRMATVGDGVDDLLPAQPHCIVKCSPTDPGSCFPLSSIRPF